MSHEARIKMAVGFMLVTLQFTLALLFAGQALGVRGGTRADLENQDIQTSATYTDTALYLDDVVVYFPLIAKDATNVSQNASLCRYGVVAKGQEQVDRVGDFGVGFYVHFGGFLFPATNAVDIVGMVDIRQDKLPDGTYLPSYSISPELEDSGLGIWIDERPGTLWMVGNEVDRGPDPGGSHRVQGDTFPEIYAEAYHDVYHFIKERDPTARVANSGLVQVTPGRLQYLDKVWDTYWDIFKEPMPVDVWNMHVYILPEAELNGQPNSIANIAVGTDPELAIRGPAYGQNYLCVLDEIYCVVEHDNKNIFAQQVMAMRRWMRDHGQLNKPLILSEFSILYPYEIDPDGCFLADEFGQCFDPDRVIDYLNNTFDYLESAAVSGLGYPLDGDRLVQQWAWFSINNGSAVGSVSNLLEEDKQSGNLGDLTEVGQVFQSRVLGQTSYVNLVPGQMSYPVAFTDPISGTADVTLRATVGNNGNMANDIEFEITFYEDEGLSDVIDTVTVPAPDPGHQGLSGCAMQEITISVNWPDLTPGGHRYWMKVDSSGAVAEGPPGSQVEELDNVSTGLVIVDPFQYFIPTTFR